MDKVLIKIDTKLELVQQNEILSKLYYTLAVLPSQSEIDSYNKKNNTNYQLEKIREIISETSTDLPLFDIISQNIYLIPANQVFYYVKEKHYRIPTEKIFFFLKNALDKAKSVKLKHKLEKNVHFLENYNFNTLFNTYLKVIYTNSNQIGRNLTDCRRISFLPYLTTLDNSPYYTRSEIINMSLNLNLIKPDLTLYEDSKLDNLCSTLISNDISSEILIKHQLYIEKNNAQHIIYYYTFYGSLYYNKYLRNTSNIYDKYMVNNIEKLNSLINKAPAFDNDVYVYRFVNSDDYLQHIRINGIYTENSFISTSRNPFYEAKNHVFGYILLKIKIPKNKEGLGLCVETYSLFPNEQEIILAPGKLKLISTSEDIDDFTYFHTDINAQRLIRKKYEFEYIDSIEKINFNNYSTESNTIYNLPEHFSLINTDPTEKIIEFYRSVPIVNDMHYFTLGEYIFQVFYLEKGLAYQKYYFLLKQNPENQEILFLVLQNPKTQEINLIIEINESISVNYLHQFTGAYTLKDDELIKILRDICNLFNIKSAIIHPKYKKYNNEKSFQDIKDININKLDEYYDEQIVLNFSSDLTMYNDDIFSYIHNNNQRFENNQLIINKMNLNLLDRFKRLSPELILQIEDTDELYRIYKKNKFANINTMILYLQENLFYMIPIFIEKLSRIIKINPFISGYYIFIIEEYMINDQNILNNTLLDVSFNDKNDSKKRGI